jgi:hypothetical protein
MIINLDNPVSINNIAEISIINVNTIIEFYNLKTVMALTMDFGSINLWEGDAYDAIGQWTDTDVVNRIKELYS